MISAKLRAALRLHAGVANRYVPSGIAGTPLASISVWNGLLVFQNRGPPAKRLWMKQGLHR